MKQEMIKVTVGVVETTYGSMTIRVPKGSTKEEIEAIAEELQENEEVDIDWDDTYMTFNA